MKTSLPWVALLFSLLCATNGLADAYATFPVDVIEEHNDGTEPAGCSSMGNEPGGPPEVSLDLDDDGTADICLGSYDDFCNAPVNFDCSSGIGGSMCSEQSGGEFMGDDATAATNNGIPVGPNYDTSPGSISDTPLSTALVVGFHGASTNANLTGYFNLQINAVDTAVCSYSFGSVYVDDGREGLAYGDTFVDEPATPVPTMGIWGLGILSGMIGLMGIYFRRRMQA